MTSPIVSEMTEAEMNQNMVFTPTRPTAAASSICAIPATRVAKTKGAMIILIILRKTVVMMPKLSAQALAWSAGR